MKAHGGSVNFGSFVGSQTDPLLCQRDEVRSTDTARELETMKRLVRNAMNDGAFGLASALIYPPDTFVSTADLIALARAKWRRAGESTSLTCDPRLTSFSKRSTRPSGSAGRGEFRSRFTTSRPLAGAIGTKARLAIAKIAEARAQGGSTWGPTCTPIPPPGPG